MASAMASLAGVCGSCALLLLLLLLLPLCFCLSLGQGSLLMHTRIDSDRLRRLRMGRLSSDGGGVDKVGIRHA